MARVESVASKRYAGAFWSLTQDQKLNAKEILSGLEGVAAAVAESKDLQYLLVNPKYTIDEKMSVVAAIARRYCDSQDLEKFLQTTVEGGRWEVLPQIAAHYRQAWLASQGEGEARVESAFDLNDSQRRSIEQYLQKVTGKKPRTVVEVNPALGAGFRIHFEGKIVDHSLLRKVERVRQDLLGAVN